MTTTTSSVAGRYELRPIARQAVNKYALIAADLAAFLLAGLIANALHWVYLGSHSGDFLKIWTGHSADARLTMFGALVGAGVALFWLWGHYTRRRPFWDEIAEILKVLAALAVVDAALLYLAKLQFSRFWFIALWICSIAAIPAARLLAKRLLARVGVWQRPAVILGTGENAIEALAALHSEPSMGFEVRAFLTPDRRAGFGPTHIENSGRRYPLISLTDRPGAELLRLGKPTIIVAFEQDELARHANLIAKLHRYCDDLRLVPPVRGLPLFGATVHHFFRHELFFLSLRNNLARRAPRAMKRMFDFVISLFLLALLSPLLLYLALTIRQDGGPIFFLHSRIGYRGKPFPCIKFRTMVPDATTVLERLLATDPAARAEWERDFKLKDDPRVTWIGKLLREYSLDELPQLWNVLMGDMSLVGPRPIVEKELERYADHADFYLETRPGMTGLWQISGRNNTDYSYRVYLDSWYVKNWSLWYDIVILIKTIRVVLAREGAY